MLQCPVDKGDPNPAAQIPIQIRFLAAPLVGIIRSQCFNLVALGLREEPVLPREYQT